MSSNAAERAAEAAKIPDAEIRDWARSTGREAPKNGRVPDRLRAEYMTELESLGHGGQVPPAADPAAPARGPESVSKPRPARGEAKPRPVKPAAPQGGLGRLRAWLGGTPQTANGTAAKKPAAPAAPPRDRGPRRPLTRLIDTVWSELAGVAEHVNIPVARTMAWQAPFVGIVADDVIKGTPVDPVFQVLARAQQSATGLGAMVAMPVVVGLMSAEASRADANTLAGVARRQIYQRILVASIDAQLEMFGSPELASRIRRSAEDTERRQAEVDQITAMIFSDMPAVIELAEDATAEEIEAAQAAANAEADREAQIRAAAAAINYMRAPAGPDLRGVASVAAATAMGQAGQAAAAAEAAAIAEARP